MTVLFGGSSATIAQVLADAMSTELGVPVAAVSRTGAGGAVGYAYVKSRPPTGYDIVWNSNSISTVFTPATSISITEPSSPWRG